MVTIFGSHEVSDYEKWLDLAKEKNNDQELAKQMGVIDSKAYRTVDGKRVIVIHTFKTMEDAQRHAAFMQTAEFQAMLENGGGSGAVTGWLTEEIVM